MKYKRMTGLLALTLTMSLLLGACGDKAVSSAPDSAFGTQTPQPTASAAAQPPQTTASPVEQTGFGYEMTLAALGLDVQVTGLIPLGDTIYVAARQDVDNLALYTLTGEEIALPEVAGGIRAIAWDSEKFWLLTGESAMVPVNPDGTQAGDPVTLEGTGDFNEEKAAVDGDGNFYLLSGANILVFNSAGKKLSELSYQGIILDLVRLDNGQVLMNRRTDSGYFESEAKSLISLVNTESIGASLTDSGAYRVYPGWEGKALLSGSGNLYTLDPETGEMETLLGWVDSGVDPGTVTALGALGPEQIETVIWPQGEEIQRVTLTQVPASELEEKTIITVGLGDLGVMAMVDSPDTELRDAITAQAVAFNRESPDCRIRLVDYSIYENCEERLQGDLQDLDLVISAEGTLEGADLTDLTELFDDEVNRDALVSGVPEALEAEGMTSLPLYFTVKTLVGTKTTLGEAEGWTPAEFLETVKAHPDTAVLQFCNAYDTLDALVSAAGGAVEDYAALLEGASLVPVDDGAIYDLEGNGTGSAYTYLKEGKLLLLETELCQFTDLLTLQAAVGEDLVLKGYPTDAGRGAVLELPLRLAIPAGSQHRDEAWAFLKEVLTGTTETLSQLGVGFPVLASGFETLAQEALDSVTYADETGQEVTTVWVEGEPMEVAPLSQADIDRFRDYCASSSGAAAGSGSLRDSARSALKRVLEEGAEPQSAAGDIR